MPEVRPRDSRILRHAKDRENIENTSVVAGRLSTNDAATVLREGACARLNRIFDRDTSINARGKIEKSQQSIQIKK